MSTFRLAEHSTNTATAATTAAAAIYATTADTTTATATIMDKWGFKVSLISS